jgi:hypothetical protein
MSELASVVVEGILGCLAPVARSPLWRVAASRWPCTEPTPASHGHAGLNALGARHVPFCWLPRGCPGIEQSGDKLKHTRRAGIVRPASSLRQRTRPLLAIRRNGPGSTAPICRRVRLLSEALLNSSRERTHHLEIARR